MPQRRDKQGRYTSGSRTGLQMTDSGKILNNTANTKTLYPGISDSTAKEVVKINATIGKIKKNSANIRGSQVHVKRLHNKRRQVLMKDSGWRG